MAENSSSPLQSSLTGSVLIAMPQLADPNFARTVTLMLSHGEEGALGIVLGTPTKIRISEICEPFKLTWRRGRELVRFGGPCERGRIWLMHGGNDPLPDAATVLPGIHIGSSPTLLTMLAEREDVPVMVFSGYAGWGPGQLESEISQSSWLPGDVDAELIFGTPPEEVWEAALRKMSLTPAMLVSGAGASA
jgi:putative transcriptional regulator